VLLPVAWGAATPTLIDDIAARLRTVMQAGAVDPAVFATGMEAVPQLGRPVDSVIEFEPTRWHEGDAASDSEAPYSLSYINGHAFVPVVTRVIEPDGRDRDSVGAFDSNSLPLGLAGERAQRDVLMNYRRRTDEVLMNYRRRTDEVLMNYRRRTDEVLMGAMLQPFPSPLPSPLLDPGFAVPLSWPPLPDANLNPRVYLAAPGELPAGVTPEAVASASDAWRAGRATPLDDVMSIRARMREIMEEIPGLPPRLCDCPRCNPRPPDPVRTLTLGGVTLFPSRYNLSQSLADVDGVRARARAVARATLGEARWADLARDGYLEVRDRLRPELLYRLTPGRAIEVYDDGHFASYLCVGPAVAMPVDEAFAQLYLYARDAPDELRRRGNWVEQSFRTPNAF